MRSIRARLTLWFAVALTAAIGAFGATLYVVRRRPPVSEIDARLHLEARLSIRYLAESHRVLGRIVRTDPADNKPALEASLASYFETIRDFLLLVDADGRVIFSSDTASRLSFSSFERLQEPLNPLPRSERVGTFEFDPAIGPARYLVAPVSGIGPEVRGILVAASVRTLAFDPALLVQSMLVIAPVILLGAVLAGYWIAGRGLRPVEGIVEELAAIQDGRSLHRRLAVDRSSEEVARLGDAVNRMFERLEHSFAALRRFTADASHELKTPLMVLRAGVERALTNPRVPPDSLQGLDDALLEVNRMSELVDGLLTLARADEGRLPLAVEPCDLRELLNEAAETASMLAEAGGHEVTTALPAEPVRLEVDRARIRQLLLNLVTNAVKYTPPGGRVSLGLSDQGATVTLTVGDTGIGIAAGDLPHIFDRFWRADVARSREGERPGVGLGLAITKWIAEAHGGTIQVQSRPGRGTIFTVTLPRTPAAPDTAS